MKTLSLIHLTFFFAISASSSVTHAITVFTDFNGDKVHDSNITISPGITTVGVFAALSKDEITEHGGLAGFTVRFDGDGANIEGATDSERQSNINIDSIWDFVPTKTFAATDRVRVDGSTLTGDTASEPYASPLVHLFDVNLRFLPRSTPYSVQLSLAGGAAVSFIADDFFEFDSDAILQGTEVNVVPVPTAFWLFLSSLFFLKRNEIQKK